MIQNVFDLCQICKEDRSAVGYMINGKGRIICPSCIENLIQSDKEKTGNGIWVVCGDTEYYPWVGEFENYEEAKDCYDKTKPEPKENVYLAEVKERKTRSN